MGELLVGVAGFLPQEIIRSKRDGSRLTDGRDRAVRRWSDGWEHRRRPSSGLGHGRVLPGHGHRRASCADPGDVAIGRHDEVESQRPARAGDRQALHRWRRRQGQPDACSVGRSMRRPRADDLRPGLRAHQEARSTSSRAFPGTSHRPDNELFHKVVAEVGCAIIGQTSNLAPADGRLYAIRDVTATVESIPLITASILSKKLAAGLDALVMDVTFGNGAFMADLALAEELAHSIVTVARRAGLVTDALLTDMNQVLGRTAGNSLEVREAIDWLTGASDDTRLTEVVLALGAEMLVLGGLAVDVESATDRLIAAREKPALLRSDSKRW